MTDANRKLAIAQELNHGDIALKAARLLRDAGMYNDALSRLYYALYHAMTALLLTEGIEPRRHRAIASLLGTHFVATGALTAADVALVSRTYGYRDLADYERTWVATADIAATAFADVEPLIERVHGMLQRGGWIVAAG